MRLDPFGAIGARLFAGFAAAALLLALFQTARIEGLPLIGGGLKAALAQSEAQALAERKAHAATKENFVAAMRAAIEAERARLARVKLEQQEISDDERTDFQERVAGLHARHDELRAAERAGAAGAAGGQPVPGLSAAAGGAAGAAVPGLSADERLICAIQAEQLDVLIDWTLRQHRVDPNR